MGSLFRLLFIGRLNQVPHYELRIGAINRLRAKLGVLAKIAVMTVNSTELVLSLPAG
jgi:hypothetical protein